MNAIRLAREAAASAMPDEPVAKQRPPLARHEALQGEFDFLRRLLFRQTEPRGQTRDVRVHDDAVIEAEGVPQNDICRLAAHAGERDEFRHLVRDCAAVFFDERTTGRLNVLRLVPVKADAPDVGHELVGIPLRVVRRRAVLLEQFRRDEVDLFVGALRRQNGGDEQLQRVGKIQLAVGVRVRPLQPGDDLSEAGGSCLVGFPGHKNPNR